MPSSRIAFARRAFGVAALALATLAPSTAHAQWPPKELKNVKVLPADISIRSLVDTMAGFTRALGVRCQYCHVGTATAPLDSFDFVSDDKPTKVKAREMLRMVTAINSQFLANLASRREPRIVVACATCHRGVTEPRPLQQVLVSAYDAGGIDSTVAAYMALRQKYYGRAAYDFGEVALADVGQALATRNQRADALRILLLNVDSVPGSGFALRQAAALQLQMGDTSAAVSSYQRALKINANDSQSAAMLTRLGRKP